MKSPMIFVLISKWRKYNRTHILIWCGRYPVRGGQQHGIERVRARPSILKRSQGQCMEKCFAAFNTSLLKSLIYFLRSEKNLHTILKAVFINKDKNKMPYSSQALFVCDYITRYLVAEIQKKTRNENDVHAHASYVCVKRQKPFATWPALLSVIVAIIVSTSIDNCIEVWQKKI